MFECSEDEFDALARQLHESIAGGQSVALTAKALRILAAPEPAGRSHDEDAREDPAGHASACETCWERDHPAEPGLGAACRCVTRNDVRQPTFGCPVHEPGLDVERLTVEMRYHPYLNQRDDSYVAGWDDAVRVLLDRLAGSFE